MHAGHPLRAETEPDNFCCSHRCTSSATLVRGAFVLQARARPACLHLRLLGFLACPAIYAFTPIAFGFVFSKFSHLVFSPNPEANARNEHLFGSRYRFLSNPAVQSVPPNSQFPCGFRYRVLAHCDIARTCSICQEKFQTRKSVLYASLGPVEEYPIHGANPNEWSWIWTARKIPVYREQEYSAYNGHFESTINRCCCSTGKETVWRPSCARATYIVPRTGRKYFCQRSGANRNWARRYRTGGREKPFSPLPASGRQSEYVNP
jgi:hypothetical protein